MLEVNAAEAGFAEDCRSVQHVACMITPVCRTQDRVALMDLAGTLEHEKGNREHKKP
jgi:hypothetical protein